MNRVQPPARDYVPRRSGEIAASLLKAYPFFRHNTYDAGEECFVPSNAISDAKEVKLAAYEFYEWKADAYFRLDAVGPLPGALPLAVFSLARRRRCTSACRYLRRLSGTMPGAANSRRSETVSSGR